MPLAGHDTSAFGAQLWSNLFQSTCPLRGTTLWSPAPQHPKLDFNPRAPCGARPSPMPCDTFLQRCISIHVPLAGHDFKHFSHLHSGGHFNPRAPCGARLSSPAAPRSVLNFNPRAPCGARHAVKWISSGKLAFQSTCPLRGTTVVEEYRCGHAIISIHVPLAGHDIWTFL